MSTNSNTNNNTCPNLNDIFDFLNQLDFTKIKEINNSNENNNTNSNTNTNTELSKINKILDDESSKITETKLN